MRPTQWRGTTPACPRLFTRLLSVGESIRLAIVASALWTRRPNTSCPSLHMPATIAGSPTLIGQSAPAREAVTTTTLSMTTVSPQQHARTPHTRTAQRTRWTATCCQSGTARTRPPARLSSNPLRTGRAPLTHPAPNHHLSLALLTNSGPSRSDRSDVLETPTGARPSRRSGDPRSGHRPDSGPDTSPRVRHWHRVVCLGQTLCSIFIVPRVTTADQS